jgi:hypothetical protein
VIKPEPATQVVYKALGSASPSGNLPGLSSRRPSFDLSVPFPTTALWDKRINEPIRSAILHIFTEELVKKVVDIVQDTVDSGVQEIENTYCEVDDKIQCKAEEGLAEVQRTFDDCIRDMGTTACDIEAKAQQAMKAIAKEEIADFDLTINDWRSNKARQLVLERSRIATAKKDPKKVKKRLKKERGLLRKQERNLRREEQIFVKHEKEVETVEEEHRRNKVPQTPETEDE